MCSKFDGSDFENILRKHNAGHSNDYYDLVNHVSDSATDALSLSSIFGKLKVSIHLLGHNYDTLINEILKIEWTKDATLSKAYMSFIVHLLSAHAFYLKAILQMIIQTFVPKKSVLNNPDEISFDIRESDKTSFHHAHILLKKINESVPMTSSILIDLLAENFPYLNMSIYLHECYINNLIKIMINIPKYQQKILEIIVRQILQFDVRSPRHEVIELDHNDEDEGPTQFDMDGIDIELSSEINQLTATVSMNHQYADKLDVLMLNIFNYIHGICYPNGDLSVEATKSLYFNILICFEKVILPTHACCHVQFIIFYICSINELLTEGFVDYLLKKVQSPSSEPVYRQTAVAYVASLIARALFIKREFVKKCLMVLTTWSHDYIKAATISPSTQSFHHKTFYSVCQGIFYIFAFRHKDLIQTEKDLPFAQSLHLQNLVTCRLNPLKYCLPLVTTVFSSITRMHQLAFCDTIIERNKRNQIPFEKISFIDIAEDIANPLDSFFPFDPYLLKRSIKFINPLYREYDGVIEEEEEPTELEEEKHYEAEIESPQFMSFATSPVDLMMFGTSPGFKSS